MEIDMRSFVLVRLSIHSKLVQQVLGFLIIVITLLIFQNVVNDITVECTITPHLFLRLFQIPYTGFRITHLHNSLIMRPRQYSPRCSEYFGKSDVELTIIIQRAYREPLSKLRCQCFGDNNLSLISQRLTSNNLFPSSTGFQPSSPARTVFISYPFKFFN